MATYVEDILNRIDTGVAGYSQAVFTTVGGPVTTMIQGFGFLALVLIAINQVMAYKPVPIADYIRWGLRYVIVLALATSWVNFEPIYNLVTQTPANIGVSLINVNGGVGGGSPANLNAALDDLITRIFGASEEAANRSGFFGVSLMSIILTCMGCVMAVFAVLVSGTAKVGLAMAMSLAPFAIPTIMFKPTESIFRRWTEFTLGFAFIPIVLAGTIAVIVGIGNDILSTVPAQASALRDLAAFLIVSLAGISMMAKTPQLVQGITGAIMAIGSGVGEVAQGAASSRQAVSKAGEAAHSGAKTASHRGRQVAVGAIEAGRGVATGRGGNEVAKMAMEKMGSVERRPLRKDAQAAVVGPTKAIYKAAKKISKLGETN